MSRIIHNLATGESTVDEDWTPDPVARTAAELKSLVNRERDRRLAVGFDYDFGDARGVHRFGTTPQDRAGWADVKAIADAALQAGASSTEIEVRTDTGDVTITAAEWPAIQLAAAQAFQPVWQASWTVKDAIDADTVTTEAEALAHAAWPAGGG